MKVCIICNLLPWLPGGLEKVIAAILSDVPQDAQVTVVCKDNNLCGTFFKDDIRFISHKARNGLLWDYGLYNLAAARSALNDDYDVVNAHGEYGLGYSLLRSFRKRSKFVITYHGLDWLRSTKYSFGSLSMSSVIKGAVGGMLEGVPGINADIAVAVSERVKQELNIYHVHKKKILIIPNGVDIKKFCPRDKVKSRALLGLPLQYKYALFAGRDPYRKGLDVAIDAILQTKIPNLRLLVIGCSPELVSSVYNNSQIVPLGTVQQDKLPLFYNAADFVILPSRYEGSPIATLEALASGKAVIVSPMAAGDIVRNEIEGFVVDPRNFGTYSKTAKELVTNDDLLSRFENRARRRSEQYSIEIQAKRYWDLFSKLTKERL